MMMDFVSLYDLNRQVKQTLKEGFAAPVWVAAEIASVQENRSGHCYLELVDKPEGEEQVRAVAKGTIWAFTYRMLKPYFETTTGRRLGKGMKILFHAEVAFHEVYGFSLNIKDIDPTFTVGDLERKKREILLQLEEDGIIDMNRKLEMPLLPKNIAVISSPTAAGLGDFLNQLENNPYGYQFHVQLFSAVMQGEKTTESVIAALERIYEYESVFDVVVIIRGGGSQTDLSCFDSYDMAANIAQFPLPVIAGIGHERDETIADRVAFMRVKTPTAAAAFLIDAFQVFDAHVEELRIEFVSGVKDLLSRESNRQKLLAVNLKRLVQGWLGENANRLHVLSHRLGHAVHLYVYNRKGYFNTVYTRMVNRLNLLRERRENQLSDFSVQLRQKCKNRFEKERHFIELAEMHMKYVDPKNVLERGYSITRLNGRALRSVTEVKAGDIVETLIADGKLKSKVDSVGK